VIQSRLPRLTKIYEEKNEEHLRAAMKHHGEDENNADKLKDEIVEEQVTEEEDVAKLPDVGITLPKLKFDSTRHLYSPPLTPC
jgi:hypothetical protein